MARQIYVVMALQAILPRFAGGFIALFIMLISNGVIIGSIPFDWHLTERGQLDFPMGGIGDVRFRPEAAHPSG
ncbi:hypothetical protein ACO2Q2_00105 [Dyella sp. KRB-257]|uniref:hypothetical protein n=1 Tax=Dyella sp. KRB-257 TaxID=3400915 RepID=UPI003C066EEB